MHLVAYSGNGAGAINGSCHEKAGNEEKGNEVLRKEGGQKGGNEEEGNEEKEVIRPAIIAEIETAAVSGVFSRLVAVTVSQAWELLGYITELERRGKIDDETPQGVALQGFCGTGAILPNRGPIARGKRQGSRHASGQSRPNVAGRAHKN